MPFIADTFWKDAPKAPRLRVELCGGSWCVLCAATEENRRAVNAARLIYTALDTGEIAIPWGDEPSAQACARELEEALANG